MRRLPLTRSQFAFWHGCAATGPGSLGNLVRLLPLPAGLGLDQLAAAVELTVGRHQGLRTRFGIEPSGASVQLVADPGSLELTRVHLDDDAALEELCLAAGRRPMDIEQQWPIQVSAVFQGGELRHALLVVHHSAVTVRTLGIVATDLMDCVAVIRGRRALSELAAPLQPADRARYESSPAGERNGARATRHRIGQLDRLPNVSFPFHRDAPGRGYQVQLRSRAVAVAVEAVSGQLQVSRTVVIFGVVGAMLGAHTGQAVGWDVALEKGILSTTRPLVEGNVATGQVVSSLAGLTTLSDVVRKAWIDLTTALRHIDYDPNAVLEAGAAVIARRRTRVRPEVAFSCAVDSYDAAPEDPFTLLDQSSVRYSELETAAEYVAITVRPPIVPLERETDALELSIVADERLLSRADAGRVLAGVEDLLCRFASGDDVKLADLAARMSQHHWPRPPDWQLLEDGRWVDVEATRLLVLAHPDVDTVELTVSEAEPRRLLASVVSTDADLDSARLETYLLARLDQAGLVVPDSFTIEHRPGAGGPAVTLAAPALDDLLHQVAHFHRLALVDPDRGYVAQGGKASLIPAIRAGLLRSGWSGFHYAALLSPKTLREFASTLVPAGGPE